MSRFEGRVAIVSGASSGMGAATARRLALGRRACGPACGARSSRGAGRCGGRADRRRSGCGVRRGGHPGPGDLARRRALGPGDLRAAGLSREQRRRLSGAAALRRDGRVLRRGHGRERARDVPPGPGGGAGDGGGRRRRDRLHGLDVQLPCDRAVRGVQRLEGRRRTAGPVAGGRARALRDPGERRRARRRQRGGHRCVGGGCRPSGAGSAPASPPIAPGGPRRSPACTRSCSATRPRTSTARS